MFGLLSVTAGLANLRLPETLGRPLPETIMDMILLGESQNKKIFCNVFKILLAATIQGADNKLGQFLGQDIEALANRFATLFGKLLISGFT